MCYDLHVAILLMLPKSVTDLMATKGAIVVHPFLTRSHNNFEGQDRTNAMSNQLTIRLMALKSLRIPAITLRNHLPSKIRKLQKSIDRYGILAPLLVDGQGQIVDGCARYLAAKAAGLEHIPTIEISHLSSDDVRGCASR